MTKISWLTLANRKKNLGAKPERGKQTDTVKVNCRGSLMLLSGPCGHHPLELSPGEGAPQHLL